MQTACLNRVKGSECVLRIAHTTVFEVAVVLQL